MHRQGGSGRFGGTSQSLDARLTGVGRKTRPFRRALAASQDTDTKAATHLSKWDRERRALFSHDGPMLNRNRDRNWIIPERQGENDHWHPKLVKIDITVFASGQLLRSLALRGGGDV